MLAAGKKQLQTVTLKPEKTVATVRGELAVGEITNEIEREIRDRRQDLGRNLDELEDKARELVDWRTHYRNHSGLFLSAAFSAGVVAGLTMIPSAGEQRRESFEDDLSDIEASPDAYRPRHQVWTGRPTGGGTGNGTIARAARQVSDTWSEITDALLKAASARAIEFVSELVPDLQKHLRKV